MADAVDPEVDALFDLPAHEFVAARDALARARRTAGDRASAVVVKQLRRPTLSAWALNQLARRHGDDVRTLVDQGAALADAQEQALAGADVDLREPGRARMETLRRLTRAAEAELAGQGGPAHRDEVVSTLTAASLDPVSADLLLQGRLSELLEAPSGFGGPFAVAAGPPEPGSTGADAPPRRSSARATSGTVSAPEATTPELPDRGDSPEPVGEVPAAAGAGSSSRFAASPAGTTDGGEARPGRRQAAAETRRPGAVRPTAVRAQPKKKRVRSGTTAAQAEADSQATAVAAHEAEAPVTAGAPAKSDPQAAAVEAQDEAATPAAAVRAKALTGAAARARADARVDAPAQAQAGSDARAESDSRAAAVAATALDAPDEAAVQAAAVTAPPQADVEVPAGSDVQTGADAQAEPDAQAQASGDAQAQVGGDARAQVGGDAPAKAQAQAEARAQAAAAAQAAVEAAAAADAAADRVAALEDELARAREVLAEAEQEAGRRRRAAAAVARAADAVGAASPVGGRGASGGSRRR